MKVLLAFDDGSAWSFDHMQIHGARAVLADMTRDDLRRYLADHREKFLTIDLDDGPQLSVRMANVTAFTIST